MKLQNRNRLTDLVNELIVTMGEGELGGRDWEFGIDMYILLYLKHVTNKDLLYSTGYFSQYSVITGTGKEFEKE